MHQPEHAMGLRRDVGGFGGLMLTLASLSPSLGVFVVGDDMLHQAGSGTVAALAAALLLGVPMAAIYAELGSALPLAGGEYAMAGRALGPRAAFAVAAVLLLAMPLAMAITGLGIADYLHDLMPGLTAREVAFPAVIAAVLIAAASIRLNAAVTGLMVAAELAALAVTAVLGAMHFRPDGLHRLLHPTMAAGSGGMAAVPLGSLALAAGAAIFALQGYGNVVYFGEEITNPGRNVGRVVYLTLFIAAAIIMLPLAGIIAAAPALDALYRAPAPVLGFVREFGGATLAVVVSLSVAAALFNCMIAVALLYGRMLFATARDGSWPAPVNRVLGRLSRRFGSPANATLAFAAITLPLCFVKLNLLILTGGSLFVAIYATMAVAVIVGRRSGVTAHSRCRAWAHPLAPCLALAATGAMVVSDLMDAQSGRPALIITTLTYGGGALYGGYVTRRNARGDRRVAEAA